MGTAMSWFLAAKAAQMLVHMRKFEPIKSPF